MASFAKHKRIRELETQVNRLEIENDFFKKVIQYDL